MRIYSADKEETAFSILGQHRADLVILTHDWQEDGMPITTTQLVCRNTLLAQIKEAIPEAEEDESYNNDPEGITSFWIVDFPGRLALWQMFIANALDPKRETFRRVENLDEM